MVFFNIFKKKCIYNNEIFVWKRHKNAYKKIIKKNLHLLLTCANKSVNNKSACKFDGSCYNSTVIFFRPVGQEVKTPPSQGGITGSIPVQAACRITELFL